MSLTTRTLLYVGGAVILSAAFAGTVAVLIDGGVVVAGVLGMIGGLGFGYPAIALAEKHHWGAQ